MLTNICWHKFSSVVSNSLQPHGLQHGRPPCPTPGDYSNWCPLNRWCHQTISSFVIPLFSDYQSFPASGSFLISWLFTSGGQSIGASASASVLPMNIQGWFPLGLTGLIALLSKGLWRNLLQHHKSKTSVPQCSAFFMVQLLHQYMTTGKLFNVRKSQVSCHFIPKWNSEILRYVLASVFSARAPWSTGISSLVPS